VICGILVFLAVNINNLEKAKISGSLSYQRGSIRLE